MKQVEKRSGCLMFLLKFNKTHVVNPLYEVFTNMSLRNFMETGSPDSSYRQYRLGKRPPFRIENLLELVLASFEQI